MWLLSHAESSYNMRLRPEPRNPTIFARDSDKAKDTIPSTSPNPSSRIANLSPIIQMNALKILAHVDRGVLLRFRLHDSSCRNHVPDLAEVGRSCRIGRERPTRIHGYSRNAFGAC